MTAKGAARVIVWHRSPDDGPGGIEDAYHAISEQLAGTPGLLANELLRSAKDPACFAVLSEWESLAAFQVWEQGPGHRKDTSPLRRFQDRERPGGHYEIYEVTAVH